jgi:WD40 repeat protein
MYRYGFTKILKNIFYVLSFFFFRKKGPTALAKGHEGSISSCCLSSDGSLCVSGGYDLRVVLWDMNYTTAKLILRVSYEIRKMKK